MRPMIFLRPERIECMLNAIGTLAHSEIYTISSFIEFNARARSS